MRKIRVNGEDYSSSLDETELAFIGPLSLPTGINSLSEGIVKHEEDISELNSNLTPTEVSTGIDRVLAIKSGNVVQLTINSITITASASGWKVLGTLPSSLRPIQSIESAVFDNNISSFSSSHYTNLRITDDGKILVWMFSDKLTLIAAATITYITN